MASPATRSGTHSSTASSPPTPRRRARSIPAFGASRNSSTSAACSRSSTAETEAVINVDLGTEGGKYLLELGNGVLNHTAGVQVADADASITLTRDTLNRIILQEVTLADAISAGDIELDGDQSKLEALVASLDTFEFW